MKETPSWVWSVSHATCTCLSIVMHVEQCITTIMYNNAQGDNGHMTALGSHRHGHWQNY